MTLKRWVGALASLAWASGLAAANAAVVGLPPELPPAMATPVATPEADLSMKGRQGLAFGSTNGAPALTYARYFSAQDSLRLTVGGTYSYQGVPSGGPGGNTVDLGSIGSAIMELGMRRDFSPWWDIAIPFFQVGVGVRGSMTSSATNYAFNGANWWEAYRRQQELDGTVRLALGTEVFWPGHRDFSLEAGASALCYIGEQFNQTDTYSNNWPLFSGATYTQPGNSSTWLGGISTDQTTILAKVNVYFR